MGVPQSSPVSIRIVVIHEDWMIWGLLSESETCETSIFQEAYEHRHSQDGVRVHGQAVIQQLLPDGHPGKT